jgi:hypothetical protein
VSLATEKPFFVSVHGFDRRLVFSVKSPVLIPLLCTVVVNFSWAAHAMQGPIIPPLLIAFPILKRGSILAVPPVIQKPCPVTTGTSNTKGLHRGSVTQKKTITDPT